MKKDEISIIGDHQLISDEKLIKGMYKSLKWSVRLRRLINEKELKQSITNKQLIYHPLWVAKLIVIADRKPFNPKKTPMMAFVDGVSGYRGLFATNPKIETATNIMSSQRTKPVIHDENEVLKYITDVQQKQINRSYVLKKPNHKVVDFFLAYLPIWIVDISHNKIKQQFIINANTGESEQYMAGLWKTKERLII